MITIALLVAVVTLITFKYIRSKEIYQTWKKRGIKHRKPIPYFGNMVGQYTDHKHVSVIYEEICKEFADEPLVGFYDYNTPCILVQDPEYVEKVLIKDFGHFMDHGFDYDEEKNPIADHLFLMNGKRWRAFRYKLSPIFTSGKLKNMFESMVECADELDQCLKTDRKGKEMKSLMTLFTIDVMGSSIFGIQPKALENPNSKYCSLIMDIFDLKFIDKVKAYLMYFIPEFAIKLGITFGKPEAESYFTQIVQNTFEQRKRNNIQRNDFIQLLLDLKEKGKIEVQNWDPNDDHLRSNEIAGDHDRYEITDNVLLAQAYSFLTNGLDAIGLTEAHAFLEISLNQDIQEKVRTEIQEQIKLNGGLTFGALKNMVYLDKVVKETLRLHTPAPNLFRVCKKQYTFPNGFTVTEGDLLRIPLTVIHKNPNYHPEPEVFRPERFDIPPKTGAYLPFGDGPRVCIAMRYGLLSVKYAIAKILSKYRVRLNPKTKLPLIIKSNSVLNTPEQPLLVDFEAIN